MNRNYFRFRIMTNPTRTRKQHESTMEKHTISVRDLNTQLRYVYWNGVMTMGIKLTHVSETEKKMSWSDRHRWNVVQCIYCIVRPYIKNEWMRRRFGPFIITQLNHYVVFFLIPLSLQVNMKWGYLTQSNIMFLT